MVQRAAGVSRHHHRGALAPFVSLHGLIGLIGAEVGGGGVEEQQIDLQIEEVGHLVEDRLLQSRGDLKEKSMAR